MKLADKVRDKLGVTTKSCMISFRPPVYVAEQLMKYAKGVEINDLHVTLMYLGEISHEDTRGILRRRWEYWAQSTAPFQVRVNGIGIFRNGNENIMHVMVEIEREEEIRGSLLHGFPGFNASSFHGFKPHITLRYRKGRRFRWLPSVPELTWLQYRTDFCVGKARYTKMLLGVMD